jgi:hypothetical protein
VLRLGRPVVSGGVSCDACRSMMQSLPDAGRKAALVTRGAAGHTLLMAACVAHATVRSTAAPMTVVCIPHTAVRSTHMYTHTQGCCIAD